MICSSAISLTVSRRSASIIYFTQATKSSFLLVDGCPERGSLSMDVRPSLNLLNHSETRARLMACSPKAVVNVSKVAVADFPSLKQNLMHVRCSVSSLILGGKHNAPNAL